MATPSGRLKTSSFTRDRFYAVSLKFPMSRHTGIQLTATKRKCRIAVCLSSNEVCIQLKMSKGSLCHRWTAEHKVKRCFFYVRSDVAIFQPTFRVHWITCHLPAIAWSFNQKMIFPGGTRVWTGDLSICSRMLYHWAIPPCNKINKIC